jgi:cytidine deaminase
MKKNIEKELIETAIKVRQNAYAPYSKYKVGASVLTDSGEIYSGCNVENISYPLTICGERAAIFNAVSHGAKKIKALYLAANGPTPCGACRQVMAEFMSPNAKVILVDTTKKNKHAIKKLTLSKLLPFSFSKIIE